MDPRHSVQQLYNGCRKKCSLSLLDIILSMKSVRSLRIIIILNDPHRFQEEPFPPSQFRGSKTAGYSWGLKTPPPHHVNFTFNEISHRTNFNVQRATVSSRLFCLSRLYKQRMDGSRFRTLSKSEVELSW